MARLKPEFDKRNTKILGKATLERLHRARTGQRAADETDSDRLEPGGAAWPAQKL